MKTVTIYPTKEAWKQRQVACLMLSVGLECHLRNLVKIILEGDASQVSEFQQMIQYAPQATRERISNLLEGGA